MIRTFVAVELEADLRQALGQLQEQVKDRLRAGLQRLAPDVRLQWVRPESMHLTLKFLGAIEESQVERIRETLSPVLESRAAFSVEVAGLGVFPDLRDPRVLWVGLRAAQAEPGQPDALEQLSRLARDVDVALGGLGFAQETRPYSPHLTLARIKERSREIGKVLAESELLSGTPSLGSLRVRSVSLMKSDLRPSGAVYTRLWEIAFKRQAMHHER